MIFQPSEGTERERGCGVVLSSSRFFYTVPAFARQGGSSNLHGTYFRFTRRIQNHPKNFRRDSPLISKILRVLIVGTTEVDFHLALASPNSNPSSPLDSGDTHPVLPHKSRPGRHRAMSQMQRLMITAEGRTGAGAAVTVLFPFYLGVVRPPPLPEGVAGPEEPERVVMVNPLTQSMVLLPAGVMSQPGGETLEGGVQGGQEADEATRLFDPFAALMREVMMMSAMEDRPGPPPASKASIDALKSVEPNELLAGDTAAAATGQECAICLEELRMAAAGSVEVAKQTTIEEIVEDGASATSVDQQGDEMSRTADPLTTTLVDVKEMPCGHRYHGECIEKWLNMHGSCPVCRYRMPEEDKQAPKKSTADVPADRPEAPMGGVWLTTTFGFQAASEDSQQEREQ